MLKRTIKAVSSVLAAAMLASLAPPAAFAADGTGEETVSVTAEYPYDAEAVEVSDVTEYDGNGMDTAEPESSAEETDAAHDSEEKDEPDAEPDAQTAGTRDMEPEETEDAPARDGLMQGFPGETMFSDGTGIMPSLNAADGASERESVPGELISEDIPIDVIGDYSVTLHVSYYYDDTGTRINYEVTASIDSDEYTVSLTRFDTGDGSAVYQIDVYDAYGSAVESATVTLEGSIEEESPLPQSGMCGLSLEWYIDEDGTLTISGEGEMTDYPWSEYNEYITAVIVEDGVLNICSDAFSGSSCVTVTVGSGVKRIEAGAFESCDSLTDVVLSEGLEYIGSYAFKGCSSLENITIPDSVTTLAGVPGSIWSSYKSDYGMFAGCRSLQNVVIGSGITEIPDYTFNRASTVNFVLPDTLPEMGGLAFSYGFADNVYMSDLDGYLSRNYGYHTSGYNSGYSTPLIGANLYVDGELVTELAVPDGCGRIGNYAFYQNPSIERVILPESVSDIGSNAFCGCSRLREVVISGSGGTAAEGDHSIGSQAFASCPSLSVIELPQAVTHIGDDAFYSSATNSSVGGGDSEVTIWSSTSYESGGGTGAVIEIPAAVSSLGESVFYDSGFSEIVFAGDLITEIPDHTFAYCASLTSVTLPQSITAIGDSAFSYCEGLAAVSLPDGVTGIGERAFSGCESLSGISLPGSVTSIGDDAFADCTGLVTAGPAGGGYDYEFGWTDAIPAYAFSGCESMLSAVLPESVTEIGDHAFSGCYDIVSVNIPAGVKRIGESAFSDCYELTGISLPDGLTEIGSRAFMECYGLTAIEIPGTASVGGYAFYGCGSIESIVLGEGVSVIGEYAFRNCAAVDTLYLPGTITSIGEAAFMDCRSLTSLELAEGITRTGSSAFMYCYALTDVSLPSTLSVIDDYTFGSCDALKAIDIPDGVTEIGESAFDNCFSLEDTEIPESVTGIGSWAFSGCSALESLTIPDSVTSIGSSVFGDSDIIMLVYPGSYAETYAIENGMEYEYADETVSLELTVTDPDGAEIAEGYTVRWYEAGGSTPVAEGGTLHNPAEGVVYEYEIQLGEELSKLYRRPARQTAQGEEISFALERHTMITVSGTVTDESGAGLEGAGLTFSQTLNGYQNTVSAVSGEGGAFTAELPDAATTLGIRLSGYYQATRTAIEHAGGETSIDLGAIALRALPSNKITLSATLTSAAAPGDTAETAPLESFDGLSFKVFNLTTNAEITDFAVQYPEIVFTDASVSPYDMLEITATDTGGRMAAAPVNVELDENRTAECTMIFTENGRIYTGELTGNAENTVMIFREDGSLVSSCDAGYGTLSDPLPSGEYTVVFIESVSVLKNISRYSRLKGLGLSADTDFAVRTAEVENGGITELTGISVPKVDRARLSYTVASETQLTSNVNDTVVGKYITLRASYRIDSRYASENEYVTLELPEGMSIVEGSVTLDGRRVTYSRDEDGAVVVNTGSGSGVVRCYASALESGSHGISAYLGFDSDGMRLEQVIGSAQVTFEDSVISMPEITASETVTVSGTAQPRCGIIIYDNGTEAARTESNANGSWQAEVTLAGTYNVTYHEIYAVIDNTNAGMSYETERGLLVYDAGAVVPARVTMYNTAHPETSMRAIEYTTVFDFSDPTAVTSYRYWPSYPQFTFKAEFDGDASKLSDVYIITTDQSGGVTYIECEYYSDLDQWIGVHSYDNSTVPVNIEVGYNEPPREIDFSDADIEDTSAKLDALLDEMYESGAGMELTPLRETDDYTVLAAVDGATSSMYGLSAVFAVDYDKVDTSSGAFVLLNEDDPTQHCMYGRYDENFLIMIIADTEEKAAAGYLICSPGELPDAETGTEIAPGADSDPGVELFASKLKITREELLEALDEMEVDDMITGAAEGIIEELEGKTIEDFNQAASDVAEASAPGVTEVLNAVAYYQMRDRAREIREEFDELYLSFPQFIYAKCDDGSYKLSDEDMVKADTALKLWRENYESTCDHIDVSIEEFRKDVVTACVTSLAAGMAGKAIGFLSKAENAELTVKYLEKLGVNAKYSRGIIKTIVSADNMMTKVGDFMDELSGLVEEELEYYDGIAEMIGLPSSEEVGEMAYSALDKKIRDTYEMIEYYVDLFTVQFAADRQSLMMMIEGVQTGSMDMAAQIRTWIIEHYRDCDEEPEEPEKPETPVLSRSSVDMDTKTIWDPSGYVCEAVPSNRLEGVTTTAYYLGDELDEFYQPTGNKIPYVWNAEDYDQKNPLITDANGEYAWDVPEGEWQVKYEKEGYETAYSEWLPVPPPQTEVHVAMVSTEAPEVESVNIYTTGVRIEFTRYMDIPSVNTENVRVTANGVPVSGTIEPLNSEPSFDDPETEYASIFMFVPDEEMSGAAEVAIANVRGYNGITLCGGFGSSLQVKAEPQSIETQASVAAGYGEETVLTLRILPAEAGANKRIAVYSSSPSIVSAGSETVTTDETGTAYVTVKGALPGSGDISFALEGTDITAVTSVAVKGIEAESETACARVTASIESGSEVESGTAVTLSTETEGAAIYYTLDGTCPCITDSASRLLYTEPIVIENDVTIVAYAVKEGLEDSPTSAFVYTVSETRTVPVTVSGAAAGNTVIAAGYDENGMMTGFVTAEASGTGEDALELVCGRETEYVKVMEWDSLEGMKSERTAERIELK